MLNFSVGTLRSRRAGTALQNRWWHGREWTLALCLVMLLLNLGLLPGSPLWAVQIVSALQYNRPAILNGEVWRVITGNLVHWSPEHFALDVGVFLVVGWVYEPILRRAYPRLVLTTGMTVGLAILLLQPDPTIYRGLSGVDSGLFAAALSVECLGAIRKKQRWLWVAPAAGVFLAKIIYESGTGRLFFGTESLGDIGQPVPLAHAVGVLATGAYLALAGCARAAPPQAIDAGTAA